MSTNPSGNAASRMRFSVTSDFTFELFFGHETHIAQVGATVRRSDCNRAFNTVSSVTNKWTSVVLAVTLALH